MLSLDRVGGLKELVAEYIVRKVAALVDASGGGSPLVIGLGSGTTAEIAVNRLGVRFAKSGVFKAVATSYKSARIALDAGIDVLPLYSGVVPVFSFDGADEVDPELRLIKGKGGAMTSEKIVSRRSGGITVVVTEDKLVARLGLNMPVPIEVIPDALSDVELSLKKLPGFSVKSIVLREGSGKFGPVTTEHGNFILDLSVSAPLPDDAEEQIKLLPGVVESGIFSRDAKEVIVAKDNKLFYFRRGGKLEPIAE